ncbi:MAG: OmpH family outer membrane protein [Bacteroidia bacterium]
MKKTIKNLGLALLTFGALSINAQKIAHVHLDSLVSLMPEMKVIKDLAQNYMKDLEKTVVSMENEFQTKYNDYLANQNGMSDLVKKTKEDELRSLQTRIEDFKQQAQQDYQKKQGELTAPVMDKAKKAIEAVAKEGGYKYVLDTSVGNVLYSEPADDILAQVKKKLDSMPAANIPGAGGSSNGVAKDSKPMPNKGATPGKTGGK